MRVRARFRAGVALAAISLLAAGRESASPQASPAPPPPASAAAARAGGGLTLVWSRSVEPLSDVALSPQGGYVALATHTGKLALWSAASGRPVWSMAGIGLRNVAVSDQMGSVLAYDAMDRLRRRVSVYRAAADPGAAAMAAAAGPRRVFTALLGGAVWCAAISYDGSHAACGTGDRQVHLIDLGLRPAAAGHSVDGICNDLEFAPDNDYLVAGLWSQSGVETLDLAGRVRWSYLPGGNLRYDVSVSPDSRRVLAVAYRNAQQSDPVVDSLDDQGVLRWSAPLGVDAYDPTALAGDGAQASYASYTLIAASARRRARLERDLVALGPLGGTAWVKGGLFFAPTLLCILPSGGAVAYDAKTASLYCFSDQGRITARARLTSSLIYARATRDRKRLLIYTADGTLSLIRLG